MIKQYKNIEIIRQEIGKEISLKKIAKNGLVIIATGPLTSDALSKEIKEIKIQKEVVDPDDVEMLQDLIITCVNDALSKVDSATEQQMGKFNIPGIM